LNKMLQIGKSGLLAQQQKLGTLSGNIANLQTVGFKKMTTSFSEQMRHSMSADSVSLSAEVPEDRRSISLGTKTVRNFTDFRQGTLVHSDDFFHMAIEGPGFFGVRDQSDQLFLTRQGEFTLNQGVMSDASGRRLDMIFHSDPSTWDIEKLSLSENGEVFSRDDDSGELTLMAKIQLFDIQNHNRLLGAGKSSFKAIAPEEIFNSSDRPEAFGKIFPKSLERSNVDLLDEMTQLLMTQRAYQLSSKSVSSADEMMQVVNEIL